MVWASPTKLPAIRAIVFDAGGVVMRRGQFMNHLRRHYGITPEMTKSFFDGPFQECLRGHADLKEQIEPWLLKWGWQADQDAFLRLWFEKDSVVDLRVLKSIDRLRRKGFICCLATNQEKHRTSHMATVLGFSRVFDNIFSSADARAAKPEPAFFEYVTTTLALPPESVSLWDDDAANIIAARALGWDARLFSGYKDFSRVIRTYVQGCHGLPSSPPILDTGRALVCEPNADRQHPEAENDCMRASGSRQSDKIRVKVVLVNPPGDILVEEHLEPPLGLQSIASFLQQAIGIRPKILDLTKYSPETATEVLLRETADIFGFTVYCTKWDITTRLIDAVVSSRGIPPVIVLGGPNPTAMPEMSLQSSAANVVICGEGEKAFAQVVVDCARGQVTSATKKIIVGTRLAAPEFPRLDRSLVDSPETYHRRCFGRPVVTLEASRGCRNACFFCNSVVMGGGSGRCVVTKAPDLIVDEIASAQRSGFDVFRFNDDSFVFAASRSGLLDRLAGMGVRYRAFANARDLTPVSVQKLKASGCFHLSVGIESYNPANLAILGKSTSASEIRDGITIAAQNEIPVRAYFILGLPYDNLDNVGRYMEQVAVEVPFSEYALYPLIPYPGTALWRSPATWGYTILDRDFNHYVQLGRGPRRALVLRHNNFDEDDVDEWIQMTDRVFAAHGKVQSFYSEVV